jgi:S1-C subfamily serine protease
MAMLIRLTPLFLSIALLFGCDSRLDSPIVQTPESATARTDTQRHLVLIKTRNAGYSVFPDTDDPAKLDDPTFLEAMHAESANGSSFAVRADGLVITNAHVIEGTNYCTGSSAEMRQGGPPPTSEDVLREAGRRDEEVMRRGGKTPTHCLLVAQDFSKVFRAKLVKIDQKHDIAALCIQSTERELPYLRIESPQNIREGIEVLTVGSPLGNTNMMTHGYISNLDFVAIDKETGRKAERQVQFSAAILPGNSGGPLVSVASGKVVGQVVSIIMVSRMVPTQMSYANPVENLLRAIKDIPPCNQK